MKQKGFAPILVVIVLLFFAIAGYSVYKKWVIPFFQTTQSNQVSTATKPPAENNKGTNIAAVDGFTSFFFPAGSFKETETLETLVGPWCAETEGSTRFTGHGSLIRLINNSKQQPLKEFTINIRYDDSDYLHINKATYSIYRCSNTTTNLVFSEKLSSEIDQNNKTVSAQSKSLGYFGLLGQLYCPNDTREPFDDDYKINGGQDISFGVPTEDIFDSNNDVDWYLINLNKNKKYSIETIHNTSGTIPIIELSNDGVTIVQNNKTDPNTRINIDQSLFQGYVQIKVIPDKTSKAGCDAKYNLLVKEI